MRMRAAEDAPVKHSGQAHVVGVMRLASHLQRTVDACQAMIEQRVLVIRSPPRAGNVVDFDLNHCLDAVDHARDAHLFLLWRRRCWLCLLWHWLSPLRTLRWY